MNLRRKFLLMPILIVLPTLLLVPAFIATTSAATPPIVLVTKTWGGSVNEVNQTVVLDPNGNAYVTGGTYSYGAGGEDVFLLKYNPAGKLLWQRTWGGANGTDQGNGVALDSAGNVYVAGYTNSFGEKGYDALLLKYDSAGVFQYAKTWGGAGNDFGTGIAIDSSNNIYVTGWSSSVGLISPLDVILLKYNQAGVIQKTVALDSAGNQEGHGVTVDTNGNIYVTGWSDRCCAGNKDILTLKFNSTLDLQWQHYFGTFVPDIGEAVTTDSGGIYVTGSDAGVIVLLKYDSTGSLQWQKGTNGYTAGSGMGLNVDGSGTIYVGGYYQDCNPCGPSPNNAFFLNVTANGNLLYAHSLNGTSQEILGRGIGVDSFGDAYLVGTVNEAPPYKFGGAWTNLAWITVAGTDATSSGPYTLNPNEFVSSPSGTQTAPNGNQNYGGQRDTFLLKYGPEPTLTFQLSPTGSGSISFNSTSYTNGQTGNYFYGNATAQANPLIAGYMFNGWTTTGGVTAVSPSSNPTTVIITGSGSLKANFTPLGSSPITPATLILASLISLVTPITIRRRRN